MTLQEAILELIPAGGCRVKDLRAAIHPDSEEAFDAALGGMVRSGRIRLIAGIITNPGLPLAADPVPTRQTPADRVIQQRESVRAWQLAHPELGREYARRFRERQRRQRTMERGGYAARRLQQILGSGAH